MPVMECPPARAADLELTLARHIDRETWGHLRGLQIEVLENRVTVRGHSSSYYLKQRALMAAMEVLSAEPLPPQVLLEIDVGRDAPRVSEGQEKNNNWR
jgi:hypothetical protein